MTGVKIELLRALRCLLLLVMALVLGMLVGCERSEVRSQGAAHEEADSQADDARTIHSEEELTARAKEALWKQLLPEPQRSEARGVVRHEEDGTCTVVVTTPIRTPAEAGKREHLHGVDLPDNASRSHVRLYVASILRAAREHRLGGCGSSDPEVELLEGVGSERVDILLEPLVHADLGAEDTYLYEALKTLSDGRHKALIIDRLEAVPGLIAVVRDRGWPEDAAPLLLRRLQERSRDLHPEWVTAAAEVVGPEHYEDLKFQLAEGQHPLDVWMAIRGLPGMEPLDDFVAKTWRAATRTEYGYRWHQLAVVAAHYGHIDALEVFVQRLAGRHWWLELFQRLTGYGLGQDSDVGVVGAQQWFAAHKDRLVFDRSEMRYRLEG